MKKGWEIKKLGEVIEIMNGKNQQEVLSKTGQYPILGSAGNVMGYATNYICEAGTTIIGRKGNISKPLFINHKFWNVDTAFGFYPKDLAKIDVKIIYYLCLSIDFQKLNRGTTIPSLVKSELQQIAISYPLSLPEQQRIVSILDEAFSSIEQAKENLQRNLQNAKELFQSELNSIFTNKGLGWEEKRLGEICDKITDGTHFSPENSSTGDFMYITAKNIKPYYIDFTKLSYISEKDHKEIFARCPVAKGDVLYIKDGATAGIATINTIEEEFSLLSSVALFKCSPKILNIFLVHYMNSTIGRANFLGFIDGAAITRLTLVKLKNVFIPLPPIEQQKKIVQQLDKLSTETKRLEAMYQQKLDALEELKKSILQKAFSGELSEN